MIELLEAIVGAIILTIGALSILFFCLSRRDNAQDRTAWWFGVFVVLYGLRLMSTSALVRAVFDGRDQTWNEFAAVMTYVIPVPAGLFVEAIVGRGWRNMLRWMWQALAIYSIAAITIDAVTQRPRAGMFLNAPFVLSAFAVTVGHLVARWRRHGAAPQARIALAGAIIFLAISLVNTLHLDASLASADLLESIGMLALICGLGYVVGGRALRNERRLIGISREMDLAREIQQSILPRELPRPARLRAAARYLPMQDVAGDFYDYAPTGDDRFALIVADVSGHGVAAALVASMVKIAFASAAAEHGHDPSAILASINRALCGKFDRAYVTATCAVFDGVAATVTFSNAGHPPPFLQRASGAIEPLDAGGMMLAFDPGAQFRAGSRLLARGDSILFFTDGLTEATNRDGEFFGDSRLADVLARPAASDPAERLEHLCGELRAWVGLHAPMHDDVTMVIIACA
jgi:sigma-B regulation protein RsbU (phosphoserine phosphatase)